MFVVKNLSEFNLIKNKNEKIYIEDFALYLQLKKKTNVRYFYSSLAKIQNNFKEDFFSQWFKSNHSKLKENNNIEFIQCFSRTFLYEAVEYLKLKISLDTILNKEKKIYFFEDNTNFINNLKLIISFNLKLKKKIKFLKIIDDKNNEINRKQILRGAISKLNYKFYLSLPLVIFQKIFFTNKIKNKILYIKDWSSIEYFLKSKQLLISNIINIYKSFYIFKIPFKNNSHTVYNEKIRNFKLNKTIIKKIFKNNKLDYDDNVFKLLSFLLKKIIKREDKSIKEYIDIYCNFINFYNPKAIIIPDGSAFHNLLLFYLAKKNNSKVILSVDGYQCVKDYHGLLYDHSIKDTLFDYILCPGENYKKLMINHEINKFKLITVTPPIIKNLKKK